MARDKWPPSLLAREALVNVSSWRSKSAVLVILTVLVGSVFPLFMVREATSLAVQLDSLVAEGRGVVIFTSYSSDMSARITRASCEHLADATGVQRAGLLEYPDPKKGQTASVMVMELGGKTSLAHASVTLFPQLRLYGALVGSAINTHAGPTSLSVGGAAVRAAPLATQPEGISVNSTLVLPLEATTATGDTCIAVLDPTVNAEELMPLLHSRLNILDNPIRASEQLERNLDPLSIYLDRPTRFLPLLLAAVGALTAAVLNQLRASEFAAYRMSGTTRRSLALIVFLEQGLITGLGLTSALATTLVVRDQLLSPLSTACWAFAAFGLWWILAITLTIPILLRRPSRLAKDR